MEKTIRKAVRCYLIKDEKILVVKYKNDNNKKDFYDIPGGKIEEGETPEQTVIREMNEETGVMPKNIKNKGRMVIEYPKKIFDFNVFYTNEYEGVNQEFEDNISEWIEIDKLLKEDKILPNSLILNRFFIDSLIKEELIFDMHIVVDELENVISVTYNII
ncbi:MAG: NUDIX domain-containing protein [Clostridia bacterium]|nr:NUDIX domain-containing protein [Clostridia bacterium]